ncbi:MAG: hypothetical protein WC229_01165 [Candidatus Paceibacterota bacterium]|jgi:hypothetical protein
MDMEKRIVDLESKIDSIYISVEKTRKYILWTIIATVVAVILPLLALGFIVPSFINTLGNIGGLGI